MYAIIGDSFEGRLEEEFEQDLEAHFEHFVLAVGSSITSSKISGLS